jgi:hypothetical protein
MRWLPLLILAACNPSAEPAASGPAPAAEPAPATEPAPAEPAADRGCSRLPFAATVDLAEASGAHHVAASGDTPAHVVVVGDSGTAGAFVVVDAESGAELGRGNLPLDRDASDDLEGFSRSGERYVALTSGGRARHFRRTALDRFELVAKSYPIAEPDGDLACRSGRETNCGRNWEGLCLLPQPPAAGACAGFAASKRDGELVCLIWQGDRLRADPARTIAVTGKEALTGCAIDGDVLFAGSNLFGASMTYRVTGFADPAAATVTPIAPLGTGFPEAIAAADGVIYRFSDLATRPSAMDRFRCR